MSQKLEASELYQLFMPGAKAKQRQVAETNTRFVHYTSAAVGKSIIEPEKVWMRQSRCMNDFMEVQYGFDCLAEAFADESGKKVVSLLDQSLSGLGSEVLKNIDQWYPFMQQNAYVTCISEHDSSEDEHGRLSMWRAYGGTHAVAIVVNNTPFLQESDALSAWTSPVAYLTPDMVKQEIMNLADRVSDVQHRLTATDRKSVENFFFNTIMFAILCTKHPGFAEELEWRVVHCPDMHPSRHLVQSIEVVHGVPQPIFKLPLKEMPEEGFEGASLPKFLDRIIIGPSEYPSAMRRAFVTLLEARGVPDAADKVVNSGIPLR